jgi:exopolysaccharide production protein ExoQ
MDETMSQLEEDYQVDKAKIPWLSFILLIVIFFAVFHSFERSARFHADSDLQQQNISNKQANLASKLSEGSPVRRIGFALLGFFGILSLLSRRREPFRPNGFMAWPLLFFLFWCYLSILWSDNMDLTVRRLGVLTFFSLGALAVALRFSLVDLVNFVALSTGFFLVVGFITEVVTGTFFLTGQFSGTLHPNFQGASLGLLFLSTLTLARSTPQWRRLFYAVAAVAFIFLLMTKSRTAFGSTIIALMAFWTLESGSARKITLAINLVLIFALFILLFGEALLPSLTHGILMGREESTATTLSGRTLVWQECIRLASRFPFLGYGYSSFWTPDRASAITASQSWGVAEAHSAYLELVLSVGLIGMIAYLVILIAGVSRSIRYCRATGDPGYSFLIACLTFFALNGLLESMTVNPTFIGFINIVILFRLAFTEPPLRPEYAEEYGYNGLPLHV